MPATQQPELKTRRRTHPFVQYVLSLAAVISAYSLYAIFAVPILEGPPSQIRPRAKTTSSTNSPRKRDKSWLKPFVPADGWELESCKTVTVEGGTILFRDYRPLDDGYAEVFPFTLIMNAKPPRSDGTLASGVKADKPPVVVRCLKQARLKFDRPLTETMSGSGLKLEVARLVGQTTIYRPPTAIGKSDSISVVTSNIQIEPTQIFTLEQVRFAFGKNVGFGRHLKIDLKQSDVLTANPLASSGFKGVSGVRRIELASLERLRLESDGEMQFTAQPRATNDKWLKKDAPFSNRKSPLEVSCVGPFVFDFEAQVATLQQQVLVEQIDEHRDSLYCDRLKLTFATDNKQKTNTDKSGLNLKTFQAWGSPAKIVARSHDAEITGTELQYNTVTRQFEAKSDQRVTVATPEFQLVTERVNYSWPTDGSVGQIDAAGPGHLLRPALDGNDPLLVEWSKQLIVRPDGAQQHITIDGQSKVHIGAETNLFADQIELWVLQVARPNAPKLTAKSGRKQSDSWKPIRLNATGQVKIESLELNGTANRLTAIWQSTQPNGFEDSNTSCAYRTPHRVARVVQDNWRNQRPEQPVARVAMQRIEQPVNWQANPFTNVPIRSLPKVSPIDDRAGNEPKKNKIDFQGDIVDVQLKQLEGKVEVVDLKVDGNVRVIQTTTENDSSKTHKITGHQLRLVPQGDEQNRVQVSGSQGQLASFRSDQLNLDGQEIFLDQRANRLWVDGPGKVWLEPKEESKTSQPTTGKADETLTQFGEVRKLEVGWAAGMIFDGQKIYFEKDVAMLADSFPDPAQHITTSRSFSQGLSIRLEDTLSLNSATTSRKAVKIAEVVLVDHVADDKQVFQLAGDTDSTGNFQLAATNRQPPTRLQTPIVIENQISEAHGRIKERQTVIAPQATWSATTGMVRAKGPGAIQLHQRGKVKSFETPGSSAQTKPSDPDTITLTHVKFDDRLVADANKKEMLILGRVRSLTSPVRSFDDVFDPDQNTNMWPAEAVKLVCQQVQLAQWNPNASDKPSNEMIATGNAHIINSKFEATADRVSYSQLNDMLVVEGTSRTDANLWFRRNPKAQPDHLVARKILYRLSDQWTEVQNVRNVKIKSK